MSFFATRILELNDLMDRVDEERRRLMSLARDLSPSGAPVAPPEMFGSPNAGTQRTAENGALESGLGEGEAEEDLSIEAGSGVHPTALGAATPVQERAREASERPDAELDPVSEVLPVAYSDEYPALLRRAVGARTPGDRRER